jgi:CheY-like chemotaxis protein
VTVRCVLVVDDDRDLRELVAEIGASLGATVLEAGTCAEAVQLLSAHRGRIELVLLDYYMPRMTPVCCVAAIRGATEPQIPIVLVTASVDAARRAAELSLERWLAKPFAVDELVRILRDTPPRAGP